MARYKNIAEIGKERIRRVIAKITEEDPEYAKTADLGFKVFKLAPSNFKQWAPPVPKGKSKSSQRRYAKAMADFADILVPLAETINIIYEVALKEGLSLVLDINQRTEITENEIHICRDIALTDELSVNLGMQTRLKVL